VRDAARAFEIALTGDRAKLAGEVFNVGADTSNIQVLNLAFRVRDAVPGTEVVHAPTDPDLRDYNVSFEKVRRVLDFRTEHTIDDGIREVLSALREGVVDPDERRWYTLKQYVFLRDAERAHRDLAVGGRLLTVGS
jgi:nucleoside-diphosphate-sugar epimerase